MLFHTKYFSALLTTLLLATQVYPSSIPINHDVNNVRRSEGHNEHKKPPYNSKIEKSSSPTNINPEVNWATNNTGAIKSSNTSASQTQQTVTNESTTSTNQQEVELENPNSNQSVPNPTEKQVANTTPIKKNSNQGFDNMLNIPIVGPVLSLVNLRKDLDYVLSVTKGVPGPVN